MLLAAAFAAPTAACSLVTSWSGYVGDPTDGGTQDEQAGDGQAGDEPVGEAASGDGAVADGGGLADAAAAPIAFVQVTSATPPGTASTVSATFALAQEAGHLIVLVVGWGGASAITRVDDSVGNGYAPAAGPTRISAGLTQSIYYAKGIAGAPPGANTVTVTLGTSTTGLDLRVAEYAGLDPVAPFDTSAGFGGRSTAASSGPTTIGTGRELLFGAGITAGSFLGAGSAFALRKLTGAGSGVVEDRIVSSTGAYSADAPLASSASYVMQVAAFR
jgi:hypothetical protein